MPNEIVASEGVSQFVVAYEKLRQTYSMPVAIDMLVQMVGHSEMVSKAKLRELWKELDEQRQLNKSQNAASSDPIFKHVNVMINDVYCNALDGINDLL